jgi:hypothetical protein
MNLYLVTCIHRSTVSPNYNESLDVYAIAGDSTEAELKALRLMQTLNYKYTDGVNQIKLLASVNTYRADSLLVVDMLPYEN